MNPTPIPITRGHVGAPTIAPVAPHYARVDEVFALIAEHFGCTPSDLVSSCRSAPASMARAIGQYLCRSELTGYTDAEIGRFWHRERSSVTAARRTIKDLISVDAKLRAEVQALEERLRR